MDAAVELGRNPVSKHQIQPEYGDEQADAGRDCRTRIARPNSQARTRTGKCYFLLGRISYEGYLAIWYILNRGIIIMELLSFYTGFVTPPIHFDRVILPRTWYGIGPS